ncbi:MAG: hypothetical protein WCE46_07180 [Methanoregula sp.]|uniref:hypothetical protein n=1 Tax=Methanoregula sp. TaxID=2052170 RepID=UPI003C731647
MECPVCGSDCVRTAPEIMSDLPTRFLPCAECSMRVLDKRAPLSALEYAEPCSCGKRFIDEVFAHMYVIMREEGDLSPRDPLIAVGSPLIHPGFAMDLPPFLPAKSLLLLSGKVQEKAARRIVAEVPEVRGVVKTAAFVPGLISHDLNAVPRVYTLLAGCDVRADIYPLATGPLVVYKQQSLIHIEFPRAGYPKLRSVVAHVGKPPVPFFVDAFSGPGTLGLAAACLGVPHVVMNDAWYASAFWSAFNLEVNRVYFDVDKVQIYGQVRDMARHPVAREPVKIAETTGRQVIEVYQGDFLNLDRVIPKDAHPVAALDIFDKNDRNGVSAMLRDWQGRMGGDVFVP